MRNATYHFAYKANFVMLFLLIIGVFVYAVVSIDIGELIIKIGLYLDILCIALLVLELMKKE